MFFFFFFPLMEASLFWQPVSHFQHGAVVSTSSIGTEKAIWDLRKLFLYNWIHWKFLYVCFYPLYFVWKYGLSINWNKSCCSQFYSFLLSFTVIPCVHWHKVEYGSLAIGFTVLQFASTSSSSHFFLVFLAFAQKQEKLFLAEYFF